MTESYSVGRLPSTTIHRNGKWQSPDGGECPICHHRGDWCGVSPDGAVANCHRQPIGAFKTETTSDGTSCYYHWLIEPPAESHAVAAEVPAEAPKRADVGTRHAVYSAMLGALNLRAKHLDDLVKRGLNPAEVSHRGYKTLEPKGQVRLAAELHARFGTSTLLSVPGFFVNPKGLLSTCILPGLLVPVRDSERRIVALKVRPDEKLDAGNKYLWVSSSKHGGPGPGSPPHVPIGIGVTIKRWRLTEGELKADVATVLSGVPTISAPGATNWKPCLPVLKALGCKTVRLAFDADAWENATVGKALGECFKALKAEGFAVELERWDPAAGKGIDDVLAASGAVEVLTGDDAARAVEAATQEPPGSAATEGGARLTVKASAVESKEIHWVYPGVIAAHFITMFAGMTGLGKTFVALDIVARHTTGGEMPDGSGGRFEVGSALIISEDPHEYMLKPRLEALGADLDRVDFLTWEAMARYTLSGTDLLHAAWEEAGRPGLVVIDPPTNFLGAVDEHRNGDVRGVLMGLVAWMERLETPVAILMITHVSKSGGKNVAAIMRVIGSVAWTSSSRLAFAFASDPDDPGRCLFLPLKTNIGPRVEGLAYRVVPKDKLAVVRWDGKTETTADEAMNGEPRKGRGQNAVEWLAARFRERCEWPSQELMDLAKGAGISRNALFDDEVKVLPITRRKVGTSWSWIAQPGWPPGTGTESASPF